MSKKNGYKKVVHWIITDKKLGSAFEDFQKIAIFNGKNPFEFLSDKIFGFVSLNKPISFTLLTEKELIEDLDSRKLSVTRTTLNKWRQSNVLELNFHWFTDGHNIVYNMEECVELIQRKLIQ